MKPKEQIRMVGFEIHGWGTLFVTDMGDCRTGTAIGQSFSIDREAGGVMDYSEMKRLGEFLLEKVKAAGK